MTVRERIIAKLEASLVPSHLEVINESFMHNVPKGSETHFKVVVVSDHFDGLSSVRRHQLVYRVLEEEMKSGVHALAITSRSPQEWATHPEANASPKCLGGGAR